VLLKLLGLYRLTTIAIFIYLAILSWGKLGDLVIDIGHEVETPTRILDGQILYRDIQSYYSPLANYVNAGILMIFGRNLAVFYGIGLGLSFLLTVLLYELVRRIVDEKYACLTCTVVLTYCAFSPGLSNLVFPYSYAATYGTLITAVLFLAIQKYLARPHFLAALSMGTLCGLALLAKQEYGIACLGAVFLVLTLRNLDGEPRSFLLKFSKLAVDLLLVLTPLVLVVALALGYFLQHVSWHQLIDENLFPFQKFAVYKNSELFNASPAKTLAVWGKNFLVFLASSAPVVLALWGIRHWVRSEWGQILLATTMAAPFSFLLLFLFTKTNGLPFLPLSRLHWSIGVFAVVALRYRVIASALGRPTAVLLLAILTDVFLLNLRWLLSMELYPIYALFLVVLFGIALGLLEPYLKRLVLPRSYLASCVILMLLFRTQYFSSYDGTVTSPYGTIRTRQQPEMTQAFNQALAFLKREVRPEDRNKVLVLSEGMLLNFLSGTHSPSRQTTFLPGVLLNAQEETAFIREMDRSGVRYIVLVDRPYPEWTYKEYRNFNPLVYRWIIQGHRQVAAFPDAKDGHNLIRIYQPFTARAS
jgi:4-amino-4-deoxy-L-arabinose transferase-like glycosyltransferase